MATSFTDTDEYKALFASVDSAVEGVKDKLAEMVRALEEEKQTLQTRVGKLENQVAELQGQVRTRDDQIVALKNHVDELFGMRAAFPPHRTTGSVPPPAPQQPGIRHGGDTLGKRSELEGLHASPQTQEGAGAISVDARRLQNRDGGDTIVEAAQVRGNTAVSPALNQQLTVPKGERGVKYPVTEPVEPQYKFIKPNGQDPGREYFPEEKDYLVKTAPEKAMPLRELPEKIKRAIRMMQMQYCGSPMKNAGKEWFKKLNTSVRRKGSAPICLHSYVCNNTPPKTTWTTELAGEFACLTCTNKQRPCLRWDQEEKKIVVLPLAEVARSDATPDACGYWVSALVIEELSIVMLC